MNGLVWRNLICICIYINKFIIKALYTTSFSRTRVVHLCWQYDLTYCGQLVGFVLSAHTYNIYSNAMTIDIEQNGFWKRLPGCIWQP